MFRQASRSLYQTVNSWLFKVIPSIHCRRRKRKIWLTVIGLSFLLGIILTLSFHDVLPAKEVLNAQLVNTLSETETKTDSVKPMLFDLQSVLGLENYTINDPLSVSRREEHLELMAPFCSVAKQHKHFVSPPKVTVIYSLHKITSMQQVLSRLRHNFAAFSSGVTDDVIVTADASLPEKDQERLDDELEKCDVCRVFFFNGTIYEQRNLASNFARRDVLLFIDGRVQASGDWLRHMLVDLDMEKRVVSPKLQLINTDGTLENVGTAVNEIQWDLTVARGNPGLKVIQKALRDNLTYISQTVITKEVFLISKPYFKAIGQFDTSPSITGSEHVMFSLKVLSCGGAVVVSMCSTVYMTIPADGAQPSYPYTDYYNPTFSINLEEYTSRLYLDVISNVFLDSFSVKYYRCVYHVLNLTSYHPAYPTRSPFMRHRGVQLSPARHKAKLEQYLLSSLKSMKCLIKNFRLILKDHQPGTVAPTKFATLYGYIRTLDGLWAVGLLPVSLEPAFNATYPSSSSWTSLDGKVVLTRNSSLWLGPFSFTNGAFIFGHKWCLTLLPSKVYALSKCASGTAAQLFAFAGGVIRQEGNTICAAVNANISNPLFLSPCKGHNFTNKFKLDTHFVSGCIT